MYPIRPNSTAHARATLARPAVTLVELTIAVALMVVVFSAVVPLFRGIHNSWDTRQANADMIQNGRVLIEHLRGQLAKAKKITAVSGSMMTNGYIEFRGNDDKTYRYDISGSHYVEFGQTGSLADLAGPVGTLRFSCYDDSDLTTPITDGNKIRLVKIETVLTESASMGQDRTWTTSVQLRCDPQADQALVGWWRFDEASGATAHDSSEYKYDGTLKGYSDTTKTGGSSWTAGVLDGALLLDGTNDYVTLPIGQAIAACQSTTVATWVNFSTASGSWARIFDFGSDTDTYMFLAPRIGTTGAMRFGITTGGWAAESTLTAPDALPTGWHHVAVTIDGPTKTMQLYQDGKLLDTQTTKVLPSDLGKTSNNWLGRSQYSGDGYFKGSLDDLRIYNYVVSSTRFADLFAIGDMVQHLPLDETSGTTAYDKAGSNNGTLVNGPTWTTGTWSGALSFDGSNDYVSSSRTIQYHMTLAAWVKTTSTAIGPMGNPNQWWDGEGIVDADKDGNYSDFGCSNNRGKFCFGTGQSGHTDITVLSTVKINDGSWHHVAATRDGASGKIQLYIDGAADASGTGYTGNLNAATAMRIGAMLDQGRTPDPDPQRIFLGLIDDVRIYGRVLTADQIALLLQ